MPIPTSPNTQSEGASRVPNDCEEIEKALKRQIEETKAFLASIGDGVVATDNEGRIIFINQSATDMTQWETSDTAGKFWGDLVKVEDELGVGVPIEKRAIMQALATKKIVATKYWYYRKDGSNFFASAIANPVIIDGGIHGAILTFRDITRERAIDRAKTEFVSLASHQLRTPLATINWYAEILLSGEMGKAALDQVKYLKEIQDASMRMTKLINALLNVSRIELGTLPYNPTPADFKQIVDGIVVDFRLKINAKKLNFDVQINPDLGPVVVDVNNMEMIIQNLLSNAINYTSVGGRVQLIADKKNNELQLKISDTGYGIPANQRQRIFEKFFRADNTREKETEGTGLGLYIVKALVEKMGGQISFESVENKGTTFYVKIPFNHGIKKSV